MTRALAIAAAIVAVASSLVQAASATTPAVQNEAIETRASAIAAQLRCPVCQNLSVKDSPSTVAAAFGSRIRELVEQGRSDAEIRRFFVERYGEWILLSPPKHGIALGVWLAPLVILGVGLLAAGFAVSRWSASVRQAEQLAEADPAALSRAWTRIYDADREEVR